MTVLVTFEPWREQALCAQILDDTLFFPDEGGNAPAAAAKRICRACPVAAECLTSALDNNEAYGIWGGLTSAERQQLRRDGAA